MVQENTKKPNRAQLLSCGRGETNAGKNNIIPSIIGW